MKTLGSGEQMAEEEDTEGQKQQSFMVAVFINYFPIHHFLICYFACLGMTAFGLSGSILDGFLGSEFDRRFQFSDIGTDIGPFEGLVVGLIVGGFVSTMWFHIAYCYSAGKALVWEEWNLRFMWPLFGAIAGMCVFMLAFLLFIPIHILVLIINAIFEVNLWSELAQLAIFDVLDFYNTLAIGPFIYAFLCPIMFEHDRRL